MASGADAVAALVHAYAERLDAGDLDGVADLFAAATWRSLQHPDGLRGRDEVRRVFDRVVLYDGVPRTRHVISNLVVDVDEPAGRATARCSFTVLQAATGGPLGPILAGRYEDSFARAGGAWRFTDRFTHVDLTGDLSRHYVARPARGRRG